MITTVKNSRGVIFNVRLVKNGESFGGNRRGDIHDKEDPIVEFYDARQNEGFTTLGQLVSRYYLSTILDLDGNGLDLMGYEPDWKVTGENINDIIQAFC